MRASLIFVGLISIILGAGCRTQPLESGGGGSGGSGGSGGGGGFGGAGGGGGGGIDADMAPYVDYDQAGPDLAPVGPPKPPICSNSFSKPPQGDALALARWHLEQAWQGTVTTPWTSAYTADITFSADGTYFAQTIDGSGNLPFYYDRNPESDTYKLININSDGSVSGEIFLEWLTSPDEITNITFNISGNVATGLQFDYFHAGYGPVHYDVSCTP